jgi:phosphatidylglycerol lysyltransferase
LYQEPLTLRWSVSVLAVLLSTIWLGGFAYKHVEYSNDLWWHFAFHDNASRFLRASLLVSVLAAGFGLLRLLRPARPRPGPPRAEDLARAMSILDTESRDTHGHLALTGDKYLLFSPGQRGFLMYAIQGASWITLGDPVGQDRTELIWSFSELCHQQRARPVFYQVDAETLPLYVDLGLATLKLGEEAVVPLAPFSLQGGARRQLRQTRHQLERAGARFEWVPAARVAELLPALKQVSDDWLATKHTAEKRFSVGFFQPDYLCRLPCALVRMDDRIIAFANVLMSADHSELSIDLMRYSQAAPRGAMDFLFVELMLWGQREGYQHFNLGLAPLAGLQTHPLAPAWHRAGDLLYRHGEHFYNFEGLQAYKAKFAPRWRPKYLACPGGFDLPLIMLDIATLIGGGFKGVIRH